MYTVAAQILQLCTAAQLVQLVFVRSFKLLWRKISAPDKIVAHAPQSYVLGIYNGGAKCFGATIFPGPKL